MVSRRPLDYDQQRLVVHKHGHEVVADHKGLSIDGQRIVAGGLEEADAVPGGQNPRTSPAMQVLPGGSVVYRNTVVAQLAPPPAGTSNPGEVTVYGAKGSTWQQPATDSPAGRETGSDEATRRHQQAVLIADQQRQVEQLAEDRRRTRERQAAESTDRHQQHIDHDRNRQREIAL